LNKNHNRDEEMWTFHSEDKKDMTALAVARFAPLPLSLRSFGRGQTDASSSGIDIFENQNYLCRSDKTDDCCCTSDN
jgi:hypothetical protein